MSLWQMSASAAVMIAAVLLIRMAAMNRLPKRTFTALWGVALLRLLAPVSVPSPLSVYALYGRLFAQGESAAMRAGTAAMGAVAAPIPVLHTQAAGASPWLWVWGIGAALCALYFIAAYIRCRVCFTSAYPVKNKFAAAFLAEKKAKRQIKLRQSKRVAAPLSYGVLRPVILMPEGTDWADTVCLRYVLQHEYVHIRRFDGVIDNGDGSVDPFGELRGVQRYTQQEFDQRELTDFSVSPTQVTDAVSTGEGQTGGQTFSEIFAQYGVYGIRYETTPGSGVGNVYWDDQPVRVFVDESPSGGVFTYQSADGGDISVKTVYDNAGKLTGVEKIAA